MHDLMNLEMSRTEFLKLLGVSLGSLMGFGYLISIMSKMRGGEKTITKAEGDNSEFGTRKFGV